MKRATILLALGTVTCAPAAAALAASTGGTTAPTTTQSTTTASAPAPASASAPSSTSTSTPSSGSASTPSSGSTSTRSSTGSTAGSGSDSTSTAAPAADTSATAVGVGDILAIGHTKAHADSTGGSATANALEVGGKPLIDGKTGGHQDGNGTAKGSLLDTGATPLGGLAVTPWTATASHTDTSSHSSSDAALLHAYLVDPKTADVWLFHSMSSADWNSSQATSQSSSDGAKVDLGDGALVVTLLHSETKSGDKGSSSLASINGNDIGSSDQANGSCVINLPSILKLTCLDASGGTGSNGQLTSGADVGTVSVGNGQLTGVVSGAQATGDNVPTQKQAKVLGEKTPNTSSKTPSGANSGSLPFTGADIGLLSAYGAALTGLGAAIVRMGRRRRVPAQP